MNKDELISLAEKLESAYKASDNLKDNTEVLAKPIRSYIRDAIVDYYATKEMLLAIANKAKIRAPHSIYADWRGNCLHVEAGYADGCRFVFVHNGVLKNKKQCGHRIYGQACDGTVYEDCDLTWSYPGCPDIAYDLTRDDWMCGKTAEETLRFFDTHTWKAEGYAILKREAALLKKRTDIMKRAFENYANEILEKVKKDTANLVVG